MTKLIFNLPDSTLESWKHLAAKRGLTMTETLNQIILGHQFLQQEVNKGNILLLEQPRFRQVIFS